MRRFFFFPCEILNVTHELLVMGRELCTAIHRLGDVQLVSKWLWAGEVIRCVLI